VLAVEEVPADQIESYGVVDGEQVEEGVYRVRALSRSRSRPRRLRTWASSGGTC
jgi:UTP-glucose-1-phosphate uridylyltransferase